MQPERFDNGPSASENGCLWVLVRSYYRIRRWSEAAWHALKQRLFAAYDKVRDFLITLDEETRPNRARPAHRRPGRRRRERPAAPPPPQPDMRKAAVPEDMRIYAVGDIHGRADLLKRLMRKIEEDARAAPEARKLLIFLGDYVDRGFQSKDVIDFLIEGDFSRFETYFLRGNHEAAFETFLSDPSFGPQWARFGGAETLMSYGIQPPRAKTVESEWTEVCEQLNQVLPASHRHFLSSLTLYEAFGDYVFVHAGLKPGQPLEAQNEKDILWIRDEFLSDERPFDRMVVHGHTPISEPHLDHRRIGIDTGAYLTGKLTAACLSGTNVSFLST